MLLDNGFNIAQILGSQIVEIGQGDYRL